MIDPAIERFAKSGSFDSTREAWPALKALPPDAWTKERAAQIREAARDNSQIYAAGINEAGDWWEAPDLIERHFRDLGIDDDDVTGAAGGDEDEIPF